MQLQSEPAPPRVVVTLAAYPIRRPRHGGQLRTSAMVKAYESAGFSVHSVAFFQAEVYGAADIGPNDVAFPFDSPFRLYRGDYVPPLADFMMGPFSAEDEGAFGQVARGIVSDVQVIQIEQPWLYPLARRLRSDVPHCRGALLVFSSQNIEAPMKRDMLLARGLGPAADQACADIDALEREAIRQSDLCLAVTAEDGAVLERLGARKVLLAPNGISPWVADTERMDLWRARLPARPWPIFIASAHPPNFTAFAAAAGDALACIPPGSKLVVAGGVGPHLHEELSKSRWRDLNLSRLLVLGVLDDEDLAAVKSLAHAFLLPIGAGGGSNIKTAEALYSGRPVVCTGTALRGFEEYRKLPEVIVADTPQAFQAAIRAVLGQAARGKPDAGASAMRARLTWATCLSEVPREVSRMLTERRAGE
jgi:hypothetical protein